MRSLGPIVQLPNGAIAPLGVLYTYRGRKITFADIRRLSGMIWRNGRWIKA